jgi:hypothetical protein
VASHDAVAELVREVAPSPPTPVDELAALDAGWDEIS